MSVLFTFKNYGNFSGRATRSEFWYWVLFRFSIMSLAISLDIVTGTFFLPLLVGLTSGIVGTATLLPSLCVGVRRMHDINKSGWYILLVFIPVVGWWVLLKWTLKRGDEKNNLYGHALLH